MLLVQTIPIYQIFRFSKRPEDSRPSLRCCITLPGSRSVALYRILPGSHQGVPWFDLPGSSPCYSSVVPYGSYPERCHLDVAERSYVELKMWLAATQWSRRPRTTAVLTLSERVHTVLRASRLRVGQEQRTRLMTRCWNTRGGLDRWYNFDISSHGRNDNFEAASLRNPERGFPRFPGRIPLPGTSFLFLYRAVEGLSDGIISTLHDAPSS